MNPLDPHRIESLFQEALGLDTANRAEFLLRIGGEPETRRAVEELLEAWYRVERKSAWNVDALQNMAASFRGAQLARYQIQDRIGAGGMGVVYKALRKEGEFSKVVALKIVHSDHPSLLQRFHQERQILASLDHPYIARLLDVGSTDDGSPYLAMDYVDGQPLDRYVKANALSRRDILRLFRKIAGAVSYAHGNLIVHRDLKPANILVTDAGEPKLLDFGIAKLINSDAARTATGAAAMTPEYASPEQISGGVVAAASDIYSLGVLLYELLSGSRPYRETKSPVELAEAITTVPPKPLAGVDEDLEKIVQMALRKEPGRRYSSVEQFSEDIRRYQDGYPVAARPDTRTYRARRFIGRNKTAVVACILVTGALLTGGVATWWQARIARERFNDVRRLANSYLFEFYDAIRDLPGSTPARQLVVKRALEYLDSLSRQSGKDASLEAELATAYERVAEVQGAPNKPSLGDHRGGADSLRKALGIRERIAAAEPSNPAATTNLVKCAGRLGEFLLWSGDVKSAAEIYRKATATIEGLAAREPGNVEIRSTLAGAYMSLGDVTGNGDVPNLGNVKGALEFYKKCIAIQLKVVEKRPAKRDERLSLGAYYGRRATASNGLGDYAAAESDFRKAIEVDEQLRKEDPVNVLYQREVAVYSRSLSLLYLRMERIEEARLAGDRSAEIFAALAKADPMNASAEEAVADSIYSQGRVREKGGDFAGARKLYETSIAAYQRLEARHAGGTHIGMRNAYQLLAGISLTQNRPADAIRAAGQELAIDDALLQQDARNASARRNQGVAYSQIGRAHELRGEWVEGRLWYERSIGIWDRVRADGILIPAYVKIANDATEGLGRCEKALQGVRE
jgi:tetratricopeptide (TPR) repeat protein